LIYIDFGYKNFIKILFLSILYEFRRESIGA